MRSKVGQRKQETIGPVSNKKKKNGGEKNAVCGLKVSPDS
jgi:hypothetical protein